MDLIVFDCDGVLVDSETLACHVDARLLTQAGFPYTFEEIRREFVGVSTRSMCRRIEARFGRSLPSDMPERLLAGAMAAFEAELRPIAGIADVLAQHRGARCVASSSDLVRIRRSLELTGLLPHFDPHLFSTEQVAHPKPAPDVFLFAAARMGVEPYRCLVVEDSAPGVHAACAAGMTVLGFHGGGHCAPGHAQTLRAAGATAVFEDMRELPDLLRQYP